VSKRRTYAAVPEPYANVNSLYASVLALKELVEGLTGQRGGAEDQAVMKADLPDPPQVKQGAWELIQEVASFTPQTAFDFKNLHNYRELRLMGTILPNTASTFQPMVRLSIDNGVNFLSGAADYTYVGNAVAAPTTNAVASAQSTGIPTMISEYLSASLYGAIDIAFYGFNRGTFPFVKTNVGGLGSAGHAIESRVSAWCASSTPKNAFRIFDGSSAQAFYLFAKLEGIQA
jgi:hypothetical protein